MTALAVLAAVAGGDVLAFASTVVSAIIAAVAGVIGFRASARQSESARRTAIDVAAVNAAVEKQRADQAAAAEQRRTDLAQVDILVARYEQLAKDHRVEIDRLNREHDRLRQASADQISRLQARIAALEEALRFHNVPFPP